MFEITPVTLGCVNEDKNCATSATAERLLVLAHGECFVGALHFCHLEFWLQR